MHPNPDSLVESPLRPDVGKHLERCIPCRIQLKLLRHYEDGSSGAHGLEPTSENSLSQSLQADVASVYSTFPKEDQGDGTERYRKQRLLGTGPHGNVFAVYDRQLERVVALKCLDTPPRLDLAATRDRLDRLAHPHIGRILDVHDWDEQAFTRTHYVGRDFSQVLADEPDPAQLQLWFGQLASALSALHGAGISHGSVKPENVRITPQGRLVLVDVGVGGLERRSRYRAPELQDGQGTEAGDWYAVGGMFADGLEQTLSDQLRAPDPASRPGAAEILGTLLVQRDPGAFGSTRYQQKGLLGQGGMGDVRRVWDPVLKRAVALKMMNANLASGSDAAARFRHEAQITAQLQHPAIIPVHEMAELDDGTPFFTMKEVDGITLAMATSDGYGSPDSEWTLTRMIEVFRRVCEAVSYAHHRDVVHRDLKPQNIMIGGFGEVLVLDWGLAKLLEPTEVARTPEEFSNTLKTDRATEGDETLTGWLAGTPGYMPDEQSRGLVDQIGPHTNVFALGAVLYEILTGAKAFGEGTSEKRNKAAQEGLFRDIRSLNPQAPPELAAIAAKALQARGSERYPSALQLEQDIEAWQTGAEVSAYPYSPFERLERRLRPYQAPLAVAAVGALMVTAVAMLAIFLAGNRMQLQTKLDLETGQLLVEKAQLAMGARDRIPAEVYAAGAVMVADRPEARGVLARAQRSGYPVLAHSESAACPVMTIGADSLGCGATGWTFDPTGVVWTPAAPPPSTLAADSQACTRASEPLQQFISGATGVECSANLAFMAVATEDRVDVWDLSGEMQVARLEGHDRWVAAVAWSADGRQLASAGVAGTVLIWDFQTQREIARLPGHEGLLNLRYIGSDLLAMSSAETVQLWDVSNRGGVHEVDVKVDVVDVAWTASGGLMALNTHGVLQVFEPTTGSRSGKFAPSQAAVRSIAAEPDGDRIALGLADGALLIVQPDLTVVWSGTGHARGTTALAWRKGRLASGGGDGSVRVWDPTVDGAPGPHRER